MNRRDWRSDGYNEGGEKRQEVNSDVKMRKNYKPTSLSSRQNKWGDKWQEIKWSEYNERAAQQDVEGGKKKTEWCK